MKDDGNVKESGENSNEEDPIEECIPSQHQESPICLLKQDKGQSFNVTFGGVLAGKVCPHVVISRVQLKSPLPW